jgi:hypothetical protein
MKSKPVKGSARTKRFDVGGTVGALAGLGTLAYLMSRKKKGEAGKGLGKFPQEAGDGTSGPGMADRTSDVDAGRQRALDQSKDPRANYMPEDSDRKELYSDINAKRVGTKPAPRTTRPAAKTTTSTTNVSTKATAAKDKAPSTATNASTTRADDVIGAGIRAAKNAPQSKTAPIKSKPNEERESKSYPAVAAEKKKADAERRKGQGMTPYASSGREEIMRKNRFHKEAELGRGIKKGGMVKKYANGGSVMASKMGSVKTAKPTMRSASSRADGIAIRGKTRA